MTPDELVALAVEAAEEGLAAGESPIGAVVVLGDTVIGRSYARERSAGRRLVHADQLAMEQADLALGLTKRAAPLRLAVNLEPCLMCVGTAMVLQVDEIYHGLEAPSDGAADIAAVWRPAAPDMPFCEIPRMTGGLLRSRCQGQFERYVAGAPDSGFRRWASSLAGLPD